MGLEVLPPDVNAQRRALHAASSETHPLRPGRHQERRRRRGRGASSSERESERPVQGPDRFLRARRRPAREQEDAGEPGPLRRVRFHRHAARPAVQRHRVRHGPGRLGPARPRGRARARSSTCWAPAPAGRRPEDLPPADPWPESQMLAAESELLGFYISGHPLTAYEWALEHFSLWRTRTARSNSSRPARSRGSAGWSRSSRSGSRRTKQEPMGVFRLEHLDGSVEVVAFPDAFREYGVHLQRGRAGDGVRRGREGRAVGPRSRRPRSIRSRTSTATSPSASASTSRPASLEDAKLTQAQGDPAPAPGRDAGDDLPAVPDRREGLRQRRPRRSRSPPRRSSFTTSSTRSARRACTWQ